MTIDQLLFWSALSLALVAAGYFHYRRTLRYLHIYQQEGYESWNFFNWFNESKAFDKRATAALLCLILPVVLARAWCGPGIFVAGWLIAFSTLLTVLALTEEDPRKAGKVKLKTTARANRILHVSQTLNAVLLVSIFGFGVASGSYFEAIVGGFMILLVQAYPLILTAANTLLTPYEDGVQASFATEARAQLNKYNPFIIGITGSYGKTSTKHILAEVLNVFEPAFTTPGSINTYMGITQQIRERLTEHHKFAVIEMGAYYLGSIRKLCRLTPPKAAIITGIGLMHLERFGGQDVIQQAKSELAQAVPDDGILVCNGDDLRCRKIAEMYPKKTVLFYGFESEKSKLHAYMHDVETDEAGSKFTINWNGRDYQGRTGLFGKPMLANVLASFTMACALGMKPELVLAAVANLKPEKNRLQPEKQVLKRPAGQPPAQVVTLHDAYNSNPVGFAAALDVLHEMPGERKVLITPGMIELGEMQAAENTKAATRAAQVCDLVVLVGDTNKESLLGGLQSGGMAEGKWRHCSSMKDALQYVYGNYCTGGEIILVENDLPDRYECSPTF